MGMRRGVRAPVLALGMTMAAGCSGGSAATKEPRVAEPKGAETACDSDDDCVLVEDCCGCAAGGTKMAVRQDRLEEIISREAGACEERECGSQPSDHRSCEATSARCAGGRCIPAL